ncbi:MAG: c-type cytochrome [bacterium]|nr:c-type cytochrome [bacterium]
MVIARAIILAGILSTAPAVFADAEEQADHTAAQPAEPSRGNPEAGRALYQLCKTCHGEAGEGNQKQGAPQIAGQADWYLTRQLENFRAGLRGNASGDVFGAQMRGMAMTLPNDQAVRDVVAFVQTLSGREKTASIQGNAEHGGEIYRQCATCHGDEARGNELFGAPRLNGQADWYLVRQLEKLKNGMRGRHPADDRGLQMASVTALLADDQDVMDVVVYIGNLP